jgi:hypothetical protein
MKKINKKKIVIKGKKTKKERKRLGLKNKIVAF